MQTAAGITTEFIQRIVACSLRFRVSLPGCVVAVSWLCAIEPAPAQISYTPPPRTAEDILAIFDEYKPDARRVDELRARAAERPPQVTDPHTLARFYLRRGQTARLLGDSGQAREDLTRAHDFAKVGGIELGTFVSARASMEICSGNDLVATQIRTDWFERLPRSQWGQRLLNAATLASYSRWIGDLASTRRWHSEAERTFQDARRAPD